MSLPHDAAGYDCGTNALRGHPKSLGEFVDCRTPSGFHRASSQLAQPGYGDTGRVGQGLDGPTATVKDGLPQVPKGLSHARCVAESGGKDNPSLDSSGGKCDKVQRQEHEPDAINQGDAGLAGPEPERNETMATDTNIVAAEQTNAAFREAVERRAALRAAVQAEQLPPSCLCRVCDEPLSVLEMREQLCSECEERERLAAWESHAEDMAEQAAMDRAEGYR